ncbi:MAG TPA: DUF6728 family protein [Cyclobacteriaceae bacterium]
MTTENQSSTNPKKRSRLREFFELNEVFGYFFRGKDPSRPSNFNIRMMHGINKISIVVFLLGVLYLIYKLVLR